MYTYVYVRTHTHAPYDTCMTRIWHACFDWLCMYASHALSALSISYSPCVLAIRDDDGDGDEVVKLWMSQGYVVPMIWIFR